MMPDNPFNPSGPPARPALGAGAYLSVKRDTAWEIHKQSRASEVCESLQRYVRDLESTLAETQEVAAALAAFGHSVVLSVRRIEAENPQLIIITGNVVDGPEHLRGQEVRLVQHVSQVSLLFGAVPAPPGQPAHRLN